MLFETDPLQVHKAFKFESLSNGEQTCKIKQFCGCARMVYNRA
ncbi:helix-turn-helix domain-containing protein [Bartonella sp. MR168JLCBS]